MLEFISIPALLLLGYIAGRLHGHEKLRKLRHECVRHGYGEYSRWGDGEFNLLDRGSYEKASHEMERLANGLRYFYESADKEWAKKAAAKRAGGEG